MAEKFSSTSSAPAAATAAANEKPLNRYGVVSRSAAEAFGAFVLVLGGVAVSMFGGGQAASGIQGAMAFGLLFIAGVIAVGHISGGHFNPALTLGFAIAGRLSWKDVVPYILAQVIGGAAAMGLLWVVLSGGPQQLVEQLGSLFGSVSNGFGQNSPSQFPLTSVLLLQVILTAVFAGVYLGATSGRANKALAPFAAGLTYAVAIQVTLPVSGGGLNPARSTSTVLFGDGAAGQLWLFWVAPLAGAAIAGLIYRSFEPVSPAGAVAGTETATAGTATSAGTGAVVTTAEAGAAAEPEADVDGTGTAPDADDSDRTADADPVTYEADETEDAGSGSSAGSRANDEDEARNFFDRKDKK